MRPEPEPDEWRRYDVPGGDTDYPVYEPTSERRRVRRRVGVLVVGALVVLGGTGAGITALVVNALDGDSGTTTTTTTTTTTSSSRTEITIKGSGTADLFTTKGTAAMVEALVKETGSAAVHQVVLYQTNAVLMVPTEDGSRTLLWDGVSMTAAAGGVSPRKPFDLTDLDGAVLAPLCGSEPASCTVLAGRPLPGTGSAWLTVAGPDCVHLTDLAGKPV